MASTWEAAKQSLRGILSQEEAKYIDDLSLEDMTSPDNKAIRKLAQEALGPLLTGTDVDPLQFFLEVVGLATFIQFVTCGMMFYGTEFWGHFDTGKDGFGHVGSRL